MKTIIHVFDVPVAPERAFVALTAVEQLAGWWTTNVNGGSDMGEIIHFTFGGDFNPDMQVSELEAPAVVAWRCVAGVDQWADNTFRFELTPREGGTRVSFRHDYAVELSDDDYGTYNFNWAYYLDSLRLYLETGTGKPFGTRAVRAVDVARRLAEEVFSKGDLAAFEEIVADDYVNHNIPVPGIPGTKDGFRELVEATRHAFPDVVVHLDNVVTQGEIVVFNDKVEATSTGEFLGVPANGARLSWTEIHMLRVRGNRIVEHWANFDQFGILQQLGAIPAPA